MEYFISLYEKALKVTGNYPALVHFIIRNKNFYCRFTTKNVNLNDTLFSDNPGKKYSDKRTKKVYSF